MLIMIPAEKHEEIKNALFVDIRPCSSMNPTIRGMLERWQGLKTRLRTPQMNDAPMAKRGEL
jgi:hypothetical protein